MLYDLVVDLLGVPSLGEYQFLADIFVWFFCGVLLMYVLHCISSFLFTISKKIFL